MGWIVLTVVGAVVGSLGSLDAPTLYGQLARPAWAPPAWLFGPAWTLLYTLMAVAAWLVWREQAARGRRLALTLYVVQLAANALWSWLFFAWRQGGPAFVESLVLAALVAATLVAFWRAKRVAGALLLPYLGWVCFASALTYSVWQRNPSLL